MSFHYSFLPSVNRHPFAIYRKFLKIFYYKSRPSPRHKTGEQTRLKNSQFLICFLLELTADRTKQCERDQGKKEPADRGVEEYDRVTAGL